MARGYFAVIVGNVSSEDVQKYLEQQEQHHKKDDFKNSEFKRWLQSLILQALTKTNGFSQ